MFNPLLDELPTEYGGYAINTDFRQPIKFFAMLRDPEIDETEKAVVAVLQFFPSADVYKDLGRLLEYIPQYINRGVEAKESKDDPVFDLLEDSERIYAAFLQVYHIDLTLIKMHWWTFLSLLDNLPDCTKLSEVVGIRAQKIPKGADKNWASSMRKMKDAYALGKQKTVGEKLQDIWEAF